MKIRNIVFSGFMASILMAGGAYADTTTTPVLATKGYADSIATYAKGLVTAETTARANAITQEVTDRDAAIASAVADLDSSGSQVAAAGNGWLNLTVGLTDGEVTTVTGSIAANKYDAYGDAAQALVDAKAYVDTTVDALSGTGGAITTLQTDVTNLKTTVGSSTSGLVKDVATLKTEVETTTTGLLDKMAVVQGEGAGSIAKALEDAKDYADSLADDYDAAGAAAAVQGNTNETVASVDAKVAAINGCPSGSLCYMSSTGPVVISTTGDAYTEPTTGGGSTGGTPTE